jgi:hypothetical protein
MPVGDPRLICAMFFGKSFFKRFNMQIGVEKLVDPRQRVVEKLGFAD